MGGILSLDWSLLPSGSHLDPLGPCSESTQKEYLLQQGKKEGYRVGAMVGRGIPQMFTAGI